MIRARQQSSSSTFQNVQIERLGITLTKKKKTKKLNLMEVVHVENFPKKINDICRMKKL